MARWQSWFIAAVLKTVEVVTPPPWVRIPVSLLKLNIRAYSVMVTSHLAMVEFRVRFPIDAYRDRHSNPMDNVMISKIKS